MLPEVKKKSWKEMSKEELKEEFLKCKNDVKYFIRNYIKVEHQLLGLVNFDLFPFQERIIDELESNRFNFLRKFRQAGCTTIGCAYIMHMAVFQKNKTITILSIGDTESIEILSRIKIMYDELPPWMQPKIIRGGDNKHTLELSNGCKIKARPAKKTSGRSLASYFLMIDEAAFIEHIDDIWAAVYPIISTGGRVFVLSTVNGMGNWYFNTYQEAKAGRNEFNLTEIDWWEHPQYKYNEKYEWLYEHIREKDKKYDVRRFEEITKKNIGLKRWRQEYEKEFLGTGSTYIDGESLQFLHENISHKYDTKYQGRMRVWKYPEPYFDYIMGVDTALGRELDYSSFIILNAYNGEQVAEFYSNKTSIDEFAQIIATEAMMYNVCKVIPERNGIGANLVNELFERQEYENLWLDDRGDFGINITSTNNEVMLAEMEEALRNRKITINSERLVKELLSFEINKNGKVEATKGHHDDLIAALKLAVKGLNVLIEKSPALLTKLKASTPEPLSISDRKSISEKHFKGLSTEDVKWILGRNK
jgi:hypothetical protein